MTTGKIAAQCSHATLACYKSLVKASQNGDARATQILRQWESLGQAKIAVQTKSEEEMLTLQAKARSGCGGRGDSRCGADADCGEQPDSAGCRAGAQERGGYDHQPS